MDSIFNGHQMVAGNTIITLDVRVRICFLSGVMCFTWRFVKNVAAENVSMVASPSALNSIEWFQKLVVAWRHLSALVEEANEWGT